MRCVVVGLTALIAIGCGTSLRRVQDSRVYFERCYAADFDARIPLAEKHACWTAWLEHYTDGQPPERARYARERVYAIEHGESVPRLPGIPDVAMGPRQATPMTVSSEEREIVVAEPEPEPEPPPPTTVDDEDMPVPRPRERRRRVRIPRTSNQACALRACAPAYEACLDRCPEDRDACETACEVELQACARGCF